MQPVVTYYLEMNDPGELRAKDNHDPNFLVVECEIKQFQVSKFFYGFVGGSWEWVDRLEWSDERWRDYAESADLRTWIAYKRGSPAGYYELQKQPGNEVEIVYFGLADRFLGQGHGGYLLSHAVRLAWNWSAKRVWVHTCTLDHPGALANYRARGFEVYREETS